tara:strand:- start:520 stop:1296 length:777 start_codon:yes stop_codon:yes gene_type:complete
MSSHITTATSHKNNIPAATAFVSSRLPAFSEAAKSFGRSNSQTTVSMMTLTMMTGQSPHRQVRQVLAEIEKRQMALSEAQVAYAKLREDAPDPAASDAVAEAEARHKAVCLDHMEGKICGAIKDIAVLISTYDNLVSTHGIADWTEEDFERHEVAFHIRRGFELLYRNMIELGRAKDSSIEYLTQFGVHVQVALKEVSGYIQTIEAQIAAGQRPSATTTEDFLDAMSKKYLGCAAETSQRMFGVSDITRSDFMIKKET